MTKPAHVVVADELDALAAKLRAAPPDGTTAIGERLVRLGRALAFQDNHLAEFAAQRIEAVPDAAVQARPLYLAYREWCAAVGCEPYTEALFGRRMIALGFARRPGRVRLYLGVRLVERPPPAAARARPTPAGLIGAAKVKLPRPRLEGQGYLWQPIMPSAPPPAAGELIRWAETAWRKPARGARAPGAKSRFVELGERRIIGRVLRSHPVPGDRMEALTIEVMVADGPDRPRAGQVVRRDWGRLRRLEKRLCRWPRDGCEGSAGCAGPRGLAADAHA